MCHKKLLQEKETVFVTYYKYEYDGSRQLEILLFADPKSIILMITVLQSSERTWVSTPTSSSMED